MATKMHTQGQRHDRIDGGPAATHDNTQGLLPSSAMRTAGDPETSLSQKLMSAVVGSVLTSLVGECLPESWNGVCLTRS